MKAVDALCEAEEKEDFVAMNTTVTLSGSHPIEEIAEEHYKRRVFKKFQAEFIACNNCMHETLHKETCGGGIVSVV